MIIETCVPSVITVWVKVTESTCLHKGLLNHDFIWSKNKCVFPPFFSCRNNGQLCCTCAGALGEHIGAHGLCAGMVLWQTTGPEADSLQEQKSIVWQVRIKRNGTPKYEKVGPQPSRQWMLRVRWYYKEICPLILYRPVLSLDLKCIGCVEFDEGNMSSCRLWHWWLVHAHH